MVVYVDKTFVLSINETCEFVEIADHSNRILMIEHLLEYYPMVRKLKALINSKALGDVYHIYCQIRYIGTVQMNVNALWNFAPHDITRSSEPLRSEFDFLSHLRRKSTTSFLTFLIAFILSIAILADQSLRNSGAPANLENHPV